MKHRLILFLLGISLFVSLTSMKMPAPQTGSADLIVEITPMDDLRVQLTAQNETGKKLHLSILMLESNVSSHVTETEIYTEQIAGDVSSFNRTLNLSKLEIGTYRIRLKAGKQRFNRVVDIRTRPTALTEDARIVLFK